MAASMTTHINAQLDLEQLPQVSTINFSTLHPKYRWIDLISTTLGLALPIIAALIILPLTDHNPLNIYNLTVLAVLVICILLIKFKQAKARRYALREHDILFQHGLFWQKTTAVSFNRIQHIDLTHGPLERKYKIAALKFFTAGGSSVDLKIPGLPHQNAQQLRTLILAKTGNQDAEQSHD
jgi:membrane protein YdbS with pleckstrin-like domain